MQTMEVESMRESKRPRLETVASLPEFVQKRLRQWLLMIRDPSVESREYANDNHRDFCEGKTSALEPRPADVSKIFTWQNRDVAYKANAYTDAYMKAHGVSNSWVTSPDKRDALNSWLDDQTEYLNSLNHDDKSVVEGYTYCACAKAINTFLRNGDVLETEHLKHHEWLRQAAFQARGAIVDWFSAADDTPIPKEETLLRRHAVKLKELRGLLVKTNDYRLFCNALMKQFTINHLHESFVVFLMKWYASRLNEIIMASPPCPINMVVFKGTADRRFDEKVVFCNKDMMSTSLDLQVCMSYHFSENECCINRITVLPGTHCLFVESITKNHGEMEVLFPHGTLLVTRRGRVRPVDVDDCNRPIKKMYTLDSIVIGVKERS